MCKFLKMWNVFSKFLKKFLKLFHIVTGSVYFVTISYTYYMLFCEYFFLFHILFVFVEKVGVTLLFTVLNKSIQFVPVVFITMLVKLVFIFQKVFSNCRCVIQGFLFLLASLFYISFIGACLSITFIMLLCRNLYLLLMSFVMFTFSSSLTPN